MMSRKAKSSNHSSARTDSTRRPDTQGMSAEAPMYARAEFAKRSARAKAAWAARKAAA